MNGNSKSTYYPKVKLSDLFFAQIIRLIISSAAASSKISIFCFFSSS